MPDLTDVTIAKPSTRYEGYSRAFDMVSPRDLRKARKQAREGRPGRLYQILRFFERLDSEIPGAMGSLTSAVMQEEIQVHTDDDVEETAAQAQRDFVRDLLDHLDVTQLVGDLLRGHYYGMRAHALTWGTLELRGQTFQAPVTYERLPMTWLHARKENRDDDYTTLYVGNRPYYDYPRGSVLLFTSEKLPSYRDVDFCEFGRGLAAARFGIFDWFNVEDWAAYNEAFGTPSVVGKLLEGAGPDEKELLKTAVMNLTSDARAIIGGDSEIDFLSPESGGADSYATFRQVAARARSAIIKSESLTDNMGERGSYAAMRTTNGIRLDVARGLARQVARLLNRHLVYPALDLNFSRRLARVGFKIKEVEDLAQQVRIDRQLAKLLDLSESELRERYSRRAPSGEDDTVSARGSTNPFDRVTEN